MIDRGELYKLLTLPGRKFYNLFDAPAVVLLYHRVCDLDFDPLQLSVSPENFKQHLSHLKERYHVLTADEFFFHLDKSEKFPKNSVFITFDDGYEDNFLNAMPILESFALQAMFYITTFTLGTNRENWWDDLERIVYNGSYPGSLSIKSGDETIKVELSDVSSRTTAYDTLHRVIKTKSIKEREDIFSHLYTWANISGEARASHRMMTFGQLKIFSKSSSVRIGAHTHSHASLRSFSYDDQLNDIVTSKNIIEKIIERNIEHFSYPFGTRKDFNHNTERACRESGLKSSFANIYGQVRSKSSMMSMHRMLVRDWSPEVFKIKMEGFFRN